MIAKDDLVGDLVDVARKILNHDAGNDEPQDIWEIEILRKEFTKILQGKRLK